MTASNFFDPATHGFTRVAVAVPRIRVDDPAYNAERTVELMQQAARQGASLVAFPELGLSAYTCDDLFHQRVLLDACETALQRVVVATAATRATSMARKGIRMRQGFRRPGNRGQTSPQRQGTSRRRMGRQAWR